VRRKKLGDEIKLPVITFPILGGGKVNVKGGGREGWRKDSKNVGLAGSHGKVRGKKENLNTLFSFKGGGVPGERVIGQGRRLGGGERVGEKKNRPSAEPNQQWGGNVFVPGKKNCLGHF